MDYKGLVLKGPIFELLWTGYAKMKKNMKKGCKILDFIHTRYLFVS